MTKIVPTGRAIASGLRFGEGPRWHAGALWFSDMHAQQIMRMTPEGNVSPVLSIANDPSGLGWMPDGRLLIVSMLDRKLLCWDGTELSEHADLSRLARHPCNDMVVDSRGYAYVGHFGFDKWGGAKPEHASLICVDTAGNPRVVAEDLEFPNGSAITSDGNTLIVAESYGARLTAFSIEHDGNLTNRRLWAPIPDHGVPDGICLDTEGCVWAALPRSKATIRIREGGEVTHRINHEQGAYACMLGGAQGTTLYVTTAASSDRARCRAEFSGQIEAYEAPCAHAGLP